MFRFIDFSYLNYFFLAESQQKSSKAPAIEVKSEINNDKIENQANRELKKPHFNLVGKKLVLKSLCFF